MSKNHTSTSNSKNECTKTNALIDGNKSQSKFSFFLFLLCGVNPKSLRKKKKCCQEIEEVDEFS